MHHLQLLLKVHQSFNNMVTVMMPSRCEMSSIWWSLLERWITSPCFEFYQFLLNFLCCFHSSTLHIFKLRSPIFKSGPVSSHSFLYLLLICFGITERFQFLMYSWSLFSVEWELLRFMRYLLLLDIISSSFGYLWARHFDHYDLIESSMELCLSCLESS